MALNHERTPHLLYLSLSGCSLCIRSHGVLSSELIDALRFDFGHLESAPVERPFATLEVYDRKEAPQKRGLPLPLVRGLQVRLSFRSRQIIYSDGTLVEICRDSSNSLRLNLFSDGFHNIRRHCDLFILSLLGEGLERRGFVRLHAMSVAKDQKAFSIMALSGTGKSTLLFNLLKSTDLKCFSDEILLVKNGCVFAFPLRLSLPGEIRDPQVEKFAIGEKFWFERGSKRKYLWAIPQERLSSPLPLQTLFFTTREKNRADVSVDSISWMDSLIFLSQIVLGLHLPQMAEIFLRFENFPHLFLTALQRFGLGMRLLLDRRVRRLYLPTTESKLLDAKETQNLLDQLV
jgi:hypothetical protein